MKRIFWIRRKPRKYTPYCERFDGMVGRGRPLLHICEDCRFTMKRDVEKCSRCSSTKVISCGLTARPPRATASKKKWKEFWDIVYHRNGKYSHPTGCR